MVALVYNPSAVKVEGEGLRKPSATHPGLHFKIKKYTFYNMSFFHRAELGSVSLKWFIFRSLVEKC